VVCVDSRSFLVLNALNLKGIKLLKLEDFETAELLSAKKSRTYKEYLWTITSFVPDFIFNYDASISQVTYVDSDIWFMSDPHQLYSEFNSTNRAVFITEHAFSPEYDQSQKSGKYCVQFIIFNKDESREIRNWWQKKCLEWCYDRFEDGKFGDQKYLDQWPIIFQDKIHILTDAGKALGPWNAFRFPYSDGVFFHFHGIKLLDNFKIYCGEYALPPVLVRSVFIPYRDELIYHYKLILKLGFPIKIENSKKYFLKSAKRILRLILLRASVYKPNNFA
jgi:hypothetical protein